MSNVLNTFLDENLQDLRAQGLYNEIDPVEGANGDHSSSREKANKLIIK